MNILLIGSGGREHALTSALKRSPKLTKLYVSPGNAGIAADAECVDLNCDDHNAVIDFCHKFAIEFVIIGPEQPLAGGLVDSLNAANIQVFGPTLAAAQLEASKAFTKEICYNYNIPTAASETFTDARSAQEYICTIPYPAVIKADGLAAGKGVIIAENAQQAHNAIDLMFSGKFGSAGSVVVIEEFLEGEEISFFALSDGTRAVAFGSAQDHKRVGDGDTGPNTGGMGTYSPAPLMNEALTKTVMETIINPTIRAMNDRGTPFKGMLFAGLMIVGGVPKLLEYNTRFGDPETQALMPRLESDLCEVLLATVNGTLGKVKLSWNNKATVCVIMASQGYPDAYEKGSVIRGLDKAASVRDVTIFHAGTKLQNGNYIADGGRVLGITASGNSFSEAQKLAYEAVDLIDWPEGFCRRDIGWRVLEQESF
jgi:phosphoribosylamine---glycine ligase